MKVVLSKGRLFDDSFELLKKAGIQLKRPEKRELIVKNGDHELSLAKAFDVPVYVEHGIDIGIAGRDVYEERKNDSFVPLELPFGRCRLSIALPKWMEANVEALDGYSIATKYVNISKRYFEGRGIDVEVFKLHGSIELAPALGLADGIVDIVETGNTLKANNLVEVEQIMAVSALLLVNRISQKTKFNEINGLIQRVKEVIRNGP